MTTLFDKARGKRLQSKDYDAYIDPGVSASDRKIVRMLMALMPANERGDFLYYDDRTGRVISNNLQLVQHARVEKGIVRNAMSTAGNSVQQSGPTTSSSRSTHA